ncbi:MAG: endonuclease III [Methanobacteriota archaeon]|nr:MAG: endonuclease III [Euryarchaeota archaeon]
MDVPTFRRVLRALLDRYKPRNWAAGLDPFEALVSIIVSQNSTDLVTERVMKDLAARGPISSRAILKMRPERLIAILRPAGLARQKVPKIRKIARTLVETHDGKMDAFIATPAPVAREMLLELPGVGPKTADVWLNLVAGRDTMPMDTHIARLARRWHLSAAKDYDGINVDLRRYVSERERQAGHLALISFGREICQARRPRCEVCPVYEDCDSEDKRPRRAAAKG